MAGEREMLSKVVGGVEYGACPLCKQFSHSIREDELGDAIRHFQTMYAHPLRGTPMGEVFDEKTRECAQVLIAGALHSKAGGEG